jgi:hypothetical protein
MGIRCWQIWVAEASSVPAQVRSANGTPEVCFGQMEMEMIGGFMKTASCFAIAAATSILFGAALTPAKAADLGGGCCADLEERVAELEATTARKGNRVVSLQVYGQVNKALLIWDDGVDSDAYVVDNYLSSSRVGLKGKASISSGWTAGYNIEFELLDASTNLVSQGKSGDDEASDGLLSLRQNFWYIESDRLGRISVGHQSTAGDGAYEVNLSNSLVTSNVMVGNNFFVRDAHENSNDGRLSNWASNLDAGRNDVIRYDSPSIYGFILSSSWGDNDYADVALRFKKEFGNYRIAAALAYQWDGQSGHASDHETFGGSISVMHVPSGLYATFQAADRDYESTTRADPSFWYVQGGIEKKFLPYGATTLYGEYGEYSDGAVGNVGMGSGLNWQRSNATTTDATRWGVGLNQKIDSAAMDVYIQGTFWSFEHNATNAVSEEDLKTVLVGSRIQF